MSQEAMSGKQAALFSVVSGLDGLTNVKPLNLLFFRERHRVRRLRERHRIRGVERETLRRERHRVRNAIAFDAFPTELRDRMFIK